MRPQLLSLALCLSALAAARAQDSEQGGNAPQLPVGQVFKRFEFPQYQDGKLKATFDATEAKGITLNRAETTNLRITIYDTNSKGDKTTVTSPNADLYVAEQKMRTKSGVQIQNADMTATSKECDFDLKTKKYLLRTDVKVVLTHFNLSTDNGTKPAPTAKTSPVEGGPVAPHPTQDAAPSTDTDTAPVLPAPTETK